LLKQQLKRNREDFKALAISVTRVLTILHQVAKDHPDAAKDSDQFILLCEEFSG